MASFDSILNAVIPWVIGIIAIYILYRPLKEPLAPLFSGIKNLINGIKNKVSKEDEDDELFKDNSILEYE